MRKLENRSYHPREPVSGHIRTCEAYKYDSENLDHETQVAESYRCLHGGDHVEKHLWHRVDEAATDVEQQELKQLE